MGDGSPPAVGRRQLLAASTGALATLAGCSALGDSDTDHRDTGPTPQRVGEVVVENMDDEKHSVDLLLRRDGEVVHWETYDLKRHQRGNDASWVQVPATTFGGCTPGVYRLAVRVDGGSTRDFPAASNPSTDGTSRLVLVRGSNELDHSVGAKHVLCSSPSETAE